MCGRFGNTLTGSSLARLLGLDEPPDVTPRFNIAPTQDVLAVVRKAGGERKLQSLRWGLVPFWAKDPKIGARLINARSETAADKPSFRSAFKARRCLIPADGYYEWKKGKGRERLPYHFGLPDEGGFCMAGLWERWQGPDGAAPLLTCTILTTAANELTAEVHDRMPVILEPEQFDLWLDTTVADRGRLQELLRPYPSDRMVRWRVSSHVSSFRNDDARCREPLQQLSLL